MSDPNAIAKAFVDAYRGAAASGDANALKGFYGPDSILSFDGQVAEGESIYNAVLAPRFAGGPINIRVSSVDAQPINPTGQLAIFLTGEADARPAGRFSQVFVLSPTPGGGMYIAVDICRFGTGSAQENISKDPSGLGKSFLGHYFGTYNNKAALANIYGSDSNLSFEGQTFNTRDAIVMKLSQLPSATHNMQSLDCIALGKNPAAPTSVALVTGTLTLEGETNAINFAQAFVLTVGGSGPYCANDLFRFHYC